MKAPAAPQDWYVRDKAEGLEPGFLRGLIRSHDGWTFRWRHGVWEPESKYGPSKSDHPQPPRPGHGLSRSEARARIAGQSCEICGRPAQANDHDHHSKALRGVLCHRCNRFLGIADDSLEYLEASAAYLRRYLPIEDDERTKP